MNVRLEGETSGLKSLKELKDQVKQASEIFFGTSCLEVTIETATMQTTTGRARIKWSAVEKHRVHQPPHGPAVCVYCGMEDWKL